MKGRLLAGVSALVLAVGLAACDSEMEDYNEAAVEANAEANVEAPEANAEAVEANAN